LKLDKKIQKKNIYFVFFYLLRYNFSLKFFDYLLNKLKNFKIFKLFEFDFLNINLISFNSLYFNNNLFNKLIYLNYENFYLRINFFFFFRYNKYIEYFRIFKYHEYLVR
jgi:hypothetical protein